MAELQRRIKSKWFPPKDAHTKRVVVSFKIHTGGELSHLKIDKSSGLSNADKAALAAVEHAAPFRQLPDGADEKVDTQFTFDYNVSGGGGHGTFRQC
jgi:TonB family protein